MFIVWGTLKTETFLRYKLQTTDNHAVLTPQNEIIWGYNWGGRSKTNFARKHEYAWCWSKGKDFLFNDKEITKLKKNIRTGKDYTQFQHVFGKRIITTSKDYCGWHPTTKNLEVMERIVRAYTLEGDTVLDIFMGSGSNAIAAKRSGRRYIGCERDSEYYDKLQQRIASETNVLDFVSAILLSKIFGNVL